MYVHNHCNSKYANYRFCFLISTTSVCNFEGNIPDGRRLGVGMGTASENNVVVYNNRNYSRHTSGAHQHIHLHYGSAVYFLPHIYIPCTPVLPLCTHLALYPAWYYDCAIDVHKDTYYTPEDRIAYHSFSDRSPVPDPLGSHMCTLI